VPGMDGGVARMSKVRSIMLCLLGVFALSAIAAPLASAEGLEWWVEGKPLKTTEGIAEETKVTAPFKLEATGKSGSFVIQCSKLSVEKGVIESPNKRSEKAIVFGECIAVGKPTCTVATTKSEPLVAKLEGSPGAIKLNFAPKTGTEIATYKVTGCAVEGSYSATGVMICNYEGVEAESKEHALEFTATSGSKVEIGGSNAHFAGTDEVHLASKKLWSARF
jgi:hypothetical protein